MDNIDFVMRAIAFSERYHSPIWWAFVWFILLSLWCAMVTDMGESSQVFGYTIVTYAVLILLIMIRRPATPTRLDLLLVGFGLPVLFFLGLLFIYPLAWHLRGIN